MGSTWTDKGCYTHISRKAERVRIQQPGNVFFVPSEVIGGANEGITLGNGNRITKIVLLIYVIAWRGENFVHFAQWRIRSQNNRVGQVFAISAYQNNIP